MFITNSKHKDFKIINSKDNNNKFVLRLFNFELFSKKHHSNKDLENNNVFILDLEFNSIKEIYDYIKQFKNIIDLKNYYYNEWYFKKSVYLQKKYLHFQRG